MKNSRHKNKNGPKNEKVKYELTDLSNEIEESQNYIKIKTKLHSTQGKRYFNEIIKKALK